MASYFRVIPANIDVNFAYFGHFYVKSAIYVLFYVFFGVFLAVFASLRFLFMQILSFSCVHF